MNRRQFLEMAVAPATGVVGSDIIACDIIPAPDDPAERPAFRAALARWRAEMRRQVNYDDRLYRRVDFRWVPSSFACCFVMMCDESFYDPRSGRYTLDAFLEHGRIEQPLQDP